MFLWKRQEEGKIFVLGPVASSHDKFMSGNIIYPHHLCAPLFFLIVRKYPRLDNFVKKRGLFSSKFKVMMLSTALW